MAELRQRRGLSRRSSLVPALFVCLAGLCGAALPGGSAGLASAPELVAAVVSSGATSTVGRVARATSSDRWLTLLAEYARQSADADGDDDGWFPRPIPVNLPIGRGDGKKSVSLPVLILPVPVPAPERAQQCSTQFEPARSHLPRPTHPAMHQQPQYGSEGINYDGQTAQAFQQKNNELPVAAASPPSLPPQPFERVSTRRPFYREEPTVPYLDYIVSSQQLVELYQAQVAADSELPPALVPDYTAGAGQDAVGGPSGEGARRSRHVRVRRYHLAGQFPQFSREAPVPFTIAADRASQPAAPPAPRVPHAHLASAPPTPRFDRSLMLRGELTVPRAGYTEPYTVWWDAATGAARVDLHGGATSAYRTVLPDGRVRGVEMRVDRSGESEVRRCAVTAPRAFDAGDRVPPALPDLHYFSFAGYAEAEFGRVERWIRTVSGNGGELGGARGEALTFRHELLLARAPDGGTTTPLKYSVAVDSSVLGADCDGYIHRYTELRDQRHEPAVLTLDLAEACEQVQQTARLERVEPLREYTMPHRDPRYDDEYKRFKTDHRRQYLDDTEEAVRKTLLVQHSRFVDSGNRQGATFSLEVNHLGDRLDAELEVLRGVRAGAEGLPAESFPHSREQLAAMRGRLPRAFDWRERGAVTSVRNQGSCSSCWAFAVAGAVEGALFVRTRRLVPLSEQCLVDCAAPYGGHGCGGTWPSAAYDYVRERGLRAHHHYTPYREKVLQCVDEQVPPVTHISSHVNVTRNSVQALKVAIRRHAPTVVIIDTSPKSFLFYKKGVLFDDRCKKNKAEHAVLAVGWGEARGEPHFILKNSWSAAWGEGGYVRVAAGGNTCGVLSRPSYPRLERADVDAVPDDAGGTDASD